ncbi:MAG TPA: substrate-binding domain-containing protein [Tepidisphaeraceae bacterium]|jgi:rhamnose ABC transporter rhamnose-binding protein|nr:substrate-binding domain-containing protein [Tepidisphaeraceae bacterium]
MQRTISPAVFLITAFFLAIGCEKKDSQNPATSGAASTQASAGSESSSGKPLTICLLPKKKGVPYFETCNDGAQEAAKESGSKVIYDGPSDGSAEKAASMIEKWTLQGVDVIAVSPNDPQVLAPAMKKARDKGVHVITWDSDGAPGTREFFVNQATAQEIGYQLVDTMAKDLGGAEPTGDVAIITASLTASNQNEWMKYMKERLAKYPKMTLVTVKPSNEDAKVAFQVAQDLMKAYPNLKGLFAISSVCFPAAADAVEQAGKVGQVQVTGLSTPGDMKAFVKKGTVKSVILWNTNDLGYLTVKTAEAVAHGTLKPGATSINAGRLGEKKIDGDAVLLGKIMVFNKDNIDQFSF